MSFPPFVRRSAKGSIDRPKKPSGRHAARLRRDGITARLSCSFNFLATRLGHARLSDIDPELEQFSMDPRPAPQRIGNAHLADQPADLQWHNRPATTASRLPAPIRPETRAMPADNGVRLNDRQSIANSREQPIETNQYQSVDGT